VWVKVVRFKRNLVAPEWVEPTKAMVQLVTSILVLLFHLVMAAVFRLLMGVGEYFLPRKSRMMLDHFQEELTVARTPITALDLG
jgi:hypothetical protein